MESPLEPYGALVVCVVGHVIDGHCGPSRSNRTRSRTGQCHRRGEHQSGRVSRNHWRHWSHLRRWMGPLVRGWSPWTPTQRLRLVHRLVYHCSFQALHAMIWSTFRSCPGSICFHASAWWLHGRMKKEGGSEARLKLHGLSENGYRRLGVVGTSRSRCSGSLLFALQSKKRSA